MPTGNFRGGSDSTEGDGQYRGVQRLADMTNRIRSAMVFVQKAATACEVEQRQA